MDLIASKITLIETIDHLSLLDHIFFQKTKVFFENFFSVSSLPVGFAL